ncbi:hypothetical protein [Streptomyces sp. NPDC057199]|uniref:hypothetical protein n=1 Tax=Streptomyces sp. NPDC057199 TaxID=3346047 RepID=UPI00362AE3C5
MHEHDSTPNGNPTDHGRRGFLGAAALAATSLMAVTGAAATPVHAAQSATGSGAPTRRRGRLQRP